MMQRKMIHAISHGGWKDWEDDHFIGCPETPENKAHQPRNSQLATNARDNKTITHSLRVRCVPKKKERTKEQISGFLGERFYFILERWHTKQRSTVLCRPCAHHEQTSQRRLSVGVVV
jgi:pyrroloquinoline quinone (PQQ) biosynthesis protein C